MTVKVSLTDGLGNQLFQYAAGLALAKHHGVPLWLDIGFFEKQKNHKIGKTRRDYELHHFSILAKKIAPIAPTDQDMIVKEATPYFFDKNFFSNPANSFLKGHWQCYGYVASVGKALLASMQPTKKPSSTATFYINLAKKKNAVFIHVRRQDYRKVGVALPLDYYRRAIAAMAGHVAKPCFFVFADDMAWAQKKLPLKNHEVHYVKKQSAWEDMLVMSNCRHGIIANSSFSWWGAYLLWLRRQKNKPVIIMPDKNNWANQAVGADSLFVPSWQQVNIKKTWQRSLIDKYIGKWHYKLSQKIKRFLQPRQKRKTP